VSVKRAKSFRVLLVSSCLCILLNNSSKVMVQSSVTIVHSRHTVLQNAGRGMYEHNMSYVWLTNEQVGHFSFGCPSGS
jgi:hypothetical protein